MPTMPLRCYIESLEIGAHCVRPTGSGMIIELPEAEARHATGARRLSVGDDLMVFDGQGREAAGSIAAVSRRGVQVCLGPIRSRPRPTPALTLAVAVPKGPRQDELIEKCTELGTAALQPLTTARSVAGAGDAKRGKWRRTTIEAAKQSGQAWIPELPPLATLHAVLATADTYDLVLAAMLPQDGASACVLSYIDRLRAARRVLALVGPEGGWSPEEAGAIMRAGALSVSLGPNVLRIETAAMAMAAMVHACAS